MQRAWVLGLMLAVSAGCDDGPGVAVDGSVDGPAADAGPMPDAAPGDAAPDAGARIDAGEVDAEVDAGDVDAAPPAGAIPLGPDGRPVGWTDASHGKTPDPDVALPQDRVNHLVLRCSADTWGAMLDDLSALTGADAHTVPERPAGGGGGGGGPPPGWIEACEGARADAQCEVPEGPGTCLPDPDFGLVCVPEGGFGLPPQAVAACAESGEEDPCAVDVGGGDEDGLCLDTPEGLACIPLSWLEGGPGGPGGPGGMDLYAAAAFWPRKPAWFACDVEFEGRVWYRVGVRFKGNSTLAFSTGDTHKLPLRLDFDEFEDDHPAIDDQRFFGFKQLSTVNQIADPSYLRQKLAADVFRRAGVPAPRTAFYRFSLDRGDGPIYMGLYTVSEVPRQPLLDDLFGDDDGTLYKCDGDGARFAEFHPESFHRKTNKDSDDYSNVQAFVAALNAPGDDAEAWRAGLEATFDVDGFLRYWAVNQAMVNWDTYGALAHNYYLYGDPTRDGRLAWIAWDFDLALEGESDLGLMETGPEWPLIHRLARDPVYMARYAALLAEVIEGPFAPDATAAEIARLRALVEPHIIGSIGEQPRFTALASPDDFAAAVDGLTEHVRRRAVTVRRWLDDR